MSTNTPPQDTATLLIVNKSDNAKYATLDLAKDPTPLSAKQVRLQTKLISASSNNLSYARNGTLLHWWDTYPISPAAPAMYQHDWGIVPAWGYAEIVDSTIPQLCQGSLLFGFWPMSSLPVVLTLEAFDAKGHWREVSPHRALLMNLYNRYIEAQGFAANDETLRGWTAGVAPVFGAGFQLNRYVFPTDDIRHVHPLGAGEWTHDDADLRHALLVSLSAATKTGRALASQILHNRQRSEYGPLAFLQVTSDPGVLDGRPGIPAPVLGSGHREGETGEARVSFSSRVESYESVGSVDILSWIETLRPEKIVVVDFGAKQGFLQTFMASLSSLPAGPRVVFIGVGTEMRVLSGDEMKERVAFGQKLNKIQFNSSGVRDWGMKVDGVDEYFALQDRAFTDWVSRGMGNLKLSWGHGIRGDDGLAAVWERLCAGTLEPDKVCVFNL